MERVNHLLFLSINAGPHPPEPVLVLALFLAQWLVPAAIALFVLLWIRKGEEDRAALMTATLAMLAGLMLNHAIGLVYFHPRPFMIGLGRAYLAHPPDNSFPSDHATFLLSLGLALLALRRLRISAVLLLAAGLAVAWARIYLGVHFPFDMAGSLFVSLAAGTLAKALRRRILPRIMPICVWLYESAISFCHLPPVLFPRSPQQAFMKPRQTEDDRRPDRH